MAKFKTNYNSYKWIAALIRINKKNMYKKIAIATMSLALLLNSFSFAQDTQELEAELAASKKLKGENPLVKVMRTTNSTLKRS